MMKKTVLMGLMLLLGIVNVLGQSGVSVQKCKTCNKPLKECKYKGKHPSSSSSSFRQKNTSYLRVNGSSNEINTNCTNSSGCTFVYTVATNAQDYTVSSSNAWITFRDKKKESFTVEIEANRLTRIREGYFTVTAGGTQVKVNVKQIGAAKQRATYLYLDGSPDDQVINCDSPDGCSKTYAISTDTADFVVMALPSWVKVVQKSPTSFSVRVESNPSHRERNDFFWVRAGGMQVKVNVHQVRRPRTLAKGVSDVRFSAGMGMRVSHTSVGFSGPTVGGVFNYAVNNLSGIGTTPNYSSGIGFDAHALVEIPITGGFGLATGLGLSVHNFSQQFQSSEWSFTTDNWNTAYGITQSSKEKYRITSLDIPILPQYRISLGNGNTVLSIKGGFVFGIGLSGKVRLNTQIRADNQNSSGNNTGQYSESTTTGSANLYTGSYNFTQRYSRGSSQTYTMNGTATNPFDRFNFSLRLGADFEFARFYVGLTYDIGLSNIANESYFSNVSNQIPGFFHYGTPRLMSSSLPLKNYKQRIGSLLISVGYRF